MRAEPADTARLRAISGRLPLIRLWSGPQTPSPGGKANQNQLFRFFKNFPISVSSMLSTSRMFSTQTTAVMPTTGSAQ